MAMVLGGEQDDKVLEKMIAERVEVRLTDYHKNQIYDLVKERRMEGIP